MSEPTVKIIAHSVSDRDIPLITIHARYWRGIHAEVMTHRVFSRNARSSRAVPVARMLEEIKNDPFVPRHWGKNQKGMQATEECNTTIDMVDTASCDKYGYCSREDAWLEARDRAVEIATAFMNAGYHKQIANRLLEPFMWIDTLITATDWANFMALRDHKDAEPHIRDLAQAIKEAISWSEPKKLSFGDWHLPYVSREEIAKWAGEDPDGADMGQTINLAKKVSAARCARISYKPFDGDGSVSSELRRYNQLVENWPVHASPIEHQATPDIWDIRKRGWMGKAYHRNFRGWLQYRGFVENETVWDDNHAAA